MWFTHFLNMIQFSSLLMSNVYIAVVSLADNFSKDFM